MNDKRTVEITESVDKTTSGGSWYLHFVGDEIRIEADHAPNTVAVLPWNDEGQANADYIIASFRYIQELQADNADLRRQVADLETLLRREEARG